MLKIENNNYSETPPRSCGVKNLPDDDYDSRCEISDFELVISSRVSKIFLMSFNKSHRNRTFILGHKYLGIRTVILGRSEYQVASELRFRLSEETMSLIECGYGI